METEANTVPTFLPSTGVFVLFDSRTREELAFTQRHLSYAKTLNNVR